MQAYLNSQGSPPIGLVPVVHCMLPACGMHGRGGAGARQVGLAVSGSATHAAYHEWSTPGGCRRSRRALADLRWPGAARSCRARQESLVHTRPKT